MSHSGDVALDRQLCRARSILARTIYRELRRAGCSDDEVLDFVNQVIDQLTQGAPASTEGAPPILDSESGLLSRELLEEVLDFELQHLVPNQRTSSLLLIVITVYIPDWLTSDVYPLVQELIANGVDDEIRANDVFGGWAPDHYALVLRDATVAASKTFPARLKAAIEEALRREHRLKEAVRLELRSTVWEPGIRSAREFIDRALRSVPFAPSSSQRASGASREGDSAQKEVVLALGGGAARAVAHVGVLRALRKMEIGIRGIAGTSAGALIALMHASGRSEDEILDRFLSFVDTPIYRELRRAYGRHRLQMSRGRGDRYFRASALAFLSENTLAAIPQDLFQRFVEYFAGEDCDLSRLTIPVVCAATDLIEGRQVAIAHGSAHDAVLASSAVPGLFPPQELGTRLLVDGGVLSEVPIHAAKTLAFDCPIVPVYLGRPERTAATFTNSLEVGVRVTALIHAELLRQQLVEMPFLLVVAAAEVGWLDFRAGMRLAELGEETALRELPHVWGRMKKGLHV